MEKRTLLAIILSLFVLFVYTELSPKPLPPEKLKTAQTIDNKEVMNNLETSDKGKNLVQAVVPPTPAVNESISTLESDSFLIEFSNIGGKLKKVSLKKFNYSPPVTDLVSLEGFENAVFKIEKITNSTIAYGYDDNKFYVRKIYKIIDNYLISVDISFLEKLKMSKEENLKIAAFHLNPISLDNEKNLPENYQIEKSLLEYSISTPNEIFRKTDAFEFKSSETTEKTASVNWAGFRDRYFCMIVKPEYSVEGYSIEYLNKYGLALKFMPSVITKDDAQGYKNFNSTIFVGPQDYKLLKSYKFNFEQIMNFKIGGFMDILTFGMTDIISKIIINILNFVYGIIPNWGVCIVFLSLFIFGVTYPLTLKSMSSMKKMQLLQPEINKIKDQNKNNPQKMNKEMMELYKKHRFNPFGGCLPMFLQMPIFIALYQVLWRSFSFKGAGFLWIKDLSEPDRLFILPYSIPFLGNEVNALPFLVMILMFLQQKFSLKLIVNADPSQVAQQKIMAKVVPLMIGVLFYKVASGLALYFSTFYFLSTLMQWKMSKST